MATTIANVIRAASGLLSSDGENAEYDRALVELVGIMIGADINDQAVSDTIYLMLKGR